MMKKALQLSTQIWIHDSEKDLDPPYQELLAIAQKAMSQAYVPYSAFKVGASLLLDNQQYLSGSNQENASYPLCICAEAGLLTHKGSNFPKEEILAIGIASQGDLNPQQIPAAPCGACRQIILEHECRQKLPIKIFLFNPGHRIVEINTIKDILPLYFNNLYLQ